MDDDEPGAYGTAHGDAPVTRREIERALRGLNIADLELREAMLELGARFVALTEELTRRLDGVEPSTHRPAQAPRATLEHAVASAVPRKLDQVRAETTDAVRVALDLMGDKYSATPVEIPCAELMPLCRARCCQFSFALSTADLDEGVIRWDYGQPYLIRQRKSDGYCVHNDPDARGCTVHHARPRVCREFDCRADRRVWLDYERRIPAPLEDYHAPPEEAPFDLLDRARLRAMAVWHESLAINRTFSDEDPVRGPALKPR